MEHFPFRPSFSELFHVEHGQSLSPASNENGKSPLGQPLPISSGPRSPPESSMTAVRHSHHSPRIRDRRSPKNARFRRKNSPTPARLRHIKVGPIDDSPTPAACRSFPEVESSAPSKAPARPRPSTSRILLPSSLTPASRRVQSGALRPPQPPASCPRRAEPRNQTQSPGSLLAAHAPPRES